jgi:hypothetical protein
MSKSITLPTTKLSIDDTDVTIQVEPKVLTAALSEDSEYVHEILFCLCEEMGNDRVKDYINE